MCLGHRVSRLRRQGSYSYTLLSTGALWYHDVYFESFFCMTNRFEGGQQPERQHEVRDAKERTNQAAPDGRIDNAQLIAQKDEQIERYSASIDETNDQLTDAREKLGLPPYEGVPPSVAASQEHINRLQSEKRSLSEAEKWREQEMQKDFKEGDEVIYNGDIWRVFKVEKKPSIRKDPDWHKDPEGKVEKEVKEVGMLTLVQANGQFRDWRGPVDWGHVEKATPEAKKNIESMRKDMEL